MPAIYEWNLLVSTLRVEPGWTIREFHAVLVIAIKDTETMSQTVPVDLQKYLYYRATQDIFKKYHAKIDPLLKDSSIDLAHMVKFV